MSIRHRVSITLLLAACAAIASSCSSDSAKRQAMNEISVRATDAGIPETCAPKCPPGYVLEEGGQRCRQAENPDSANDTDAGTPETCAPKCPPGYVVEEGGQRCRQTMDGEDQS
jgi:hypothetical protein